MRLCWHYVFVTISVCVNRYGSTAFARELLAQYHYQGFVPCIPFAEVIQQGYTSAGRGGRRSGTLPLFTLEELFSVGDFSSVDFQRYRIPPRELDRPSTLRNWAQSPDLCAQCDEGMTALMHAALDGNVELTRLLLAYSVSSSGGGAIHRDPDFFHSVASLQDGVFGGVTVFHIAVQRGNLDILRDIVRCSNASRSDAIEISENRTGYTPLQKAVLLVRKAAHCACCGGRAKRLHSLFCVCRHPVE